MKKIILKSVLIILGGIFMLSLFGCSANKYEIDYCGAKSSYQGAKSSYEPGVEVKLYYKNFASDMEYSFYLDGEYIPLEFDAKGAVIRFVMPEHDVKLECRVRGSMPTNAPENQNNASTVVPALQRECPSCHALTPQASSTCLSCGFEIEKYVVCPECGAEVAENAKFCSECGSKKPESKGSFCTNCGAKLPSGAKFCSECGEKV